MTRDHDAARAHTPILLLLAFGLVLASSAGCAADDAAVEWRIDEEVLPFIPICTACFMTGGADRAAVHRRSPTLLGAGAVEDTDAVDGDDPADHAGLAALWLIAVRHPGSPWVSTDAAHVTEPQDFRVYAWSSADKAAPVADDAAWLEPGEDADRARTVQFLVVDAGVSAVCDVPWFPRAKFPDDLVGFVAEQRIADTRCEPLE